MTLAARLAALERRRPQRTPPVDTAWVDCVVRALCATYAIEGPDELRHQLEQNAALRPDQRAGLLRLASNLVERARRGDPLSARQAAVLGMVHP